MRDTHPGLACKMSGRAVCFHSFPKLGENKKRPKARLCFGATRIAVPPNYGPRLRRLNPLSA